MFKLAVNIVLFLFFINVFLYAYDDFDFCHYSQKYTEEGRRLPYVGKLYVNKDESGEDQFCYELVYSDEKKCCMLDENNNDIVDTCYKFKEINSGELTQIRMDYDDTLYQFDNQNYCKTNAVFLLQPCNTNLKI